MPQIHAGVVPPERLRARSVRVVYVLLPMALRRALRHQTCRLRQNVTLETGKQQPHRRRVFLLRCRPAVQHPHRLSSLPVSVIVLRVMLLLQMLLLRRASAAALLRRMFELVSCCRRRVVAALRRCALRSVALAGHPGRHACFVAFAEGMSFVAEQPIPRHP